MSKANQTQLSTEVIDEVLGDPNLLIKKEVEVVGTKSAQIRAYAAQGMKTGEIAKKMGIRYQHVRNVLTTPLKRNQ